MLKSVVLLALLLPTGRLFAQRGSEASPPVPGNTAPPMLQRPYEAVRDFLNFYAFADGTYDSSGYYASGGNAGAGIGLVVGGGASGYREWPTGVLELSYRGDYRTYPSGTDQSLTFLARKDFSRRYSLTVTETAGILNNGGTVYSSSPEVANPSILVQSNPFNSETRFTVTDLALSYQRSVRLSFQVSGSYFINRYSGSTSYGSNSVSGAASVNYRVTRRTTVSGSYSHNHYIFQHNAGGSDVDSVFLTATHELASRWTVSGSGGFSRTASSGVEQVPLNVQIGQQIVTVVATGKYAQTSYLPYYQGIVTHSLKHDSVSLSGGQAVSPGNGLLLAARTLGINGFWVHNLRRSNLTFAGYYSRLTSVTSAASQAATTRGVGVSYSYNLIHHVGLTGRYDYLNYSSFASYGGRADNRLTFGVYFTSKDIPLGLF